MVEGLDIKINYLKLLLLSVGFLATLNSNGQKPNHLFVYIEDVTEQKPTISYGDFKIADSKLIKDSISTNMAYFHSRLEEILKSLPEEKQHVLFYIHGLWADHPSFSEPSGYILQNEVFNTKDSNYGLVISLQWEGSFNYAEDYAITKKSGELFAALLPEIFETISDQNPNYYTGFMLHSMGHQVFYHFVNNLKPDVCMNPIHMVLACAGDISDTILQDSAMLATVTKTKSTLIFHNYKDRTLKMAKTVVDGERLGVTGPKDTTCLPPSVKIIDVTSYDDFESIPGQMSLHRYFYDSPKVRKIIKEALTAF